ncbi:MAG: hypothetical protein M1381_03505 [Deltaproteobacteria bacterium]|nr:hypothetical protein [Deltaproteobacteria bacterium]
MKFRLFFETMLIGSIIAIMGCGANQAPNTAVLSINPSSISVPYQPNENPSQDYCIITTVSGPSQVQQPGVTQSNTNLLPMNGIQVKYDSPYALGEMNGGVGYLGFLDKGNPSPAPYYNTTNSQGTSLICVMLCITNQCSTSPIAFTGTAEPLTYTTYIEVSSGSATPVQVNISVN